MKKQYCVYILTNKWGTVLYIGITSNLPKRIWEHKNKIVKGFTEKYNLNKLVYYEIHEDVNEAIKKEKQIKKWRRTWKINLIQKNNPEWKDLYNDLTA